MTSLLSYVFFPGGVTNLPVRFLPQERKTMRRIVTMRDRSKNRKPLQKGRNLSIEAIQAVQALKRVSRGIGGGESVESVLRSKVRRLIKFDMMAVLKVLQEKNEPYLAMQVFRDVREEHWYIPQFTVYADMIRVLASNECLEDVRLLCSYMKSESFRADIDGFNILLSTLLDFGFIQAAMDLFLMMKVWELEPDESTFRILIPKLESQGEIDFYCTARKEAMKYFGESLNFLDAIEDTDLKCYSSGFHFENYLNPRALVGMSRLSIIRS